MPNQTYVTPQWVWDALYKVEPWAATAWDCCPENASFDILKAGFDDLPQDIATNPPYGHVGPKIVRHVTTLVSRAAFLLPADWDCAAGRRDLFNNPWFKRKYILTKRIHWDNISHKMDNKGKPIQPAGNHAWYVWNKTFSTTDYAKMVVI